MTELGAMSVTLERIGQRGCVAERLRVDRVHARSARTAQRELAARIRRYERQYGVCSSRLHVAIDAGEITETADVTRWLIDYSLLPRVRRR